MMPRKRRTPHQRREGYGDGHRFHLKLGHAYEFLGPTFGRDEAFDREAAREAWAILRPELMAEFITERPCQRPAAWWWFEAPELRRRVDGGLHPCEDPEREMEPYRGMPGSYSTEDDFRAEYESEAAYLLRLGQLLRAERDYLTDHPELLKPESHVYLLRTAILPES
ncbi:hypothetical protein EBU95_19705 [bacterium]|nr:hypothetical protein [bacterium]